MTSNLDKSKTDIITAEPTKVDQQLTVKVYGRSTRILQW